MVNKLLSYKRMVDTTVIIMETLICGGLFGLFYCWSQGSSWEKSMGVNADHADTDAVLFRNGLKYGSRSL